MPTVKQIRTWAIPAKDLAEAEKFYTSLMKAEVINRFEPNEEERARGRVAEVHIQLGNMQVQLKDASKGPPKGVPHHTLMNEWQDKEFSVKEVEESGASLEMVRDHPKGDGYSLYVRDPNDNLWELWYAKD